jgi:hypothetical protein
MLGAPSAGKPIDEEVKALALKHRGDIEAKLGHKFTKFEPESYTSQIVNGTNYVVTICTGDKKIHAKIYKPINGESSLSEAH